MMMTRYLLLTIFFLCATLVYSGPLLGIDFGTDTYKVVLVNQNYMDILMDEQSSRKTPNVVGFRRGDRYFGKLANDALRWNPQGVYPYLRDLLGKQSLDGDSVGNILPHVLYGEKLFLNSSVEDFPFLAFKHSDDVEFSVTELVAMIFQKIYQTAEKEVGFPVRDIVLTVPPFFTQAERTALVEAAKLGGFNVLSLIDQTSAVAVSYARKLLGQIESPQLTVFIDAGQSNLVLSLFNFTNTTIYSKLKAKRIDGVQFNPMSRVWDSSLGGREWDYVLTEMMSDRIKQNLDIKEIPIKAQSFMKRTLPKLKETLSANKEVSYRIENVIDDKDFSTVITREEYEELCEDLYGKVERMVIEFLEMNNVQPSDIETFELIGGSGRLPKFQEKLLSIIEREQLDFHLNGDESAAFGAAIFGRVRNSVSPIKLKDVIEWPVSVDVVGEATETEGDLSKSAVLFPQGCRLGAKKKLEFLRNGDFSIDLKYAECDTCAPFPQDSPSGITSYEVTGFPSESEYNLTTTPKVTVILELTSSGTFILKKAEAEIKYMYYPQPKVVIPAEEETENDEVENEETVEEDPAAEEDELAGDALEEEEEETIEEQPEEDPEELEPYEKTKKLPLKFKERNIHSLPKDLKKESTAKLREIAYQERIKILTQEKKNDLESLLFSVRDRVTEDEEYSLKSSEEEREKLMELVSEIGMWFEDEGFSASLTETEVKINQLKTAEGKIISRIQESSLIPQSISLCHMGINVSRSVIESVVQLRKVSEEEKQEFLQKIDQVEKWLTEVEESFTALQPYEDSQTKASEIDAKCNRLSTKLKIFQRRPLRPKETPNTESDTGEQEENNENQDNTKHEDL